MFSQIIDNSRRVIILQKEKSKSQTELRRLYDMITRLYVEIIPCLDSISPDSEEMVDSVYLFTTYLSGSLIYKSYAKELSFREKNLQSILETFLVKVERQLDKKDESQINIL